LEIGDWELGIGDWELEIGLSIKVQLIFFSPQSPIPNPQSL